MIFLRHQSLLELNHSLASSAIPVLQPPNEESSADLSGCDKPLSALA
jgi:hypothetical protein